MLPISPIRKNRARELSAGDGFGPFIIIPTTRSAPSPARGLCTGIRWFVPRRISKTVNPHEAHLGATAPALRTVNE